MTTEADYRGDTSAGVRRRFLLAVASARPPVRARDLSVAGLDRRTIQKRLERLRQAAGKGVQDDERLIEFARLELDRLAPAETRGQHVLEGLASQEARAFAREAGLQATAIGDWVEIAHSPGDRGWQRQEVIVRTLSPSSVLGRGEQQSWLAEKEAFLSLLQQEMLANPELQRDFTPNELKMDLVRIVSGTVDSPACFVEVAPIDWQTSLALNERLDSRSLTGAGTIRDRWGQASDVLARRSLPGQLIAHIVVKTADTKLLVGLRQTSGLKDELGTWSLTLEERWPASDRHPHDVVKRALYEELGVDVTDEAVRILAWGIEASVLYPGFIAVATIPQTSWEVEQFRSHGDDANEIRFLSSIPADPESLKFLFDQDFVPPKAPLLSAPWHRTSKARLFTALAYLLRDESSVSRQELLSALADRS